MKRLILLVVVVVVVFLPYLSFGAEVEIKGIYIGMTKEQLQKRWGESLALEGFTIAEVHSKYLLKGNAVMEWRDNKLASFLWFFNSDKFETVLSAVESKFPKIKCKDEAVSNRMGAQFKQTNCSLGFKGGVLTMDRFVEDIETSVLSMKSDSFISELISEAKKTNRDI